MGYIEWLDEKRVDRQGTRRFFSDPIGTPLEEYEDREDSEVGGAASAVDALCFYGR